MFPINNLVKIPDDISDELAAAIMLKGMTAEYLVRRTFKVESGQTVLFHAAAGGVGLPHRQRREIIPFALILL